MNVTFTFRHMESTEALKTAIDDKLHHVEPFISDNADIHVIFENDANLHHCEINLHDKGIHTSIQTHTEDMYKSIGKAIDKLTRQLRREKERRTAHR